MHLLWSAGGVKILTAAWVRWPMHLAKAWKTISRPSYCGADFIALHGSTQCLMSGFFLCRADVHQAGAACRGAWNYTRNPEAAPQSYQHCNTNPWALVTLGFGTLSSEDEAQLTICIIQKADHSDDRQEGNRSDPKESRVPGVPCRTFDEQQHQLRGRWRSPAASFKTCQLVFRTMLHFDDKVHPQSLDFHFSRRRQSRHTGYWGKVVMSTNKMKGK